MKRNRKAIPVIGPRPAHRMLGIVEPSTRETFTVLASSPNRAAAAAQAIDAVRAERGIPANVQVLVAWSRELTPARPAIGATPSSILPVIDGPAVVLAEQGR